VTTSPLLDDDQAASDEQALVEQLRAGEGAAYETLVREYGGRLLAVARRFLSNEEDAHDALQEAFLAAFRALPNFAGQSRLSTWLHRIVVNAALMKLRSRKRRPECSIEDLLPRFATDGHQAEPAVDWSNAAEAALERGETRAIIEAALEQLPEAYRTVLILRDLEEVDTETAATMLEVSTAVIKTRLHRARQALRTLLDRHFRGGAAC
jgi:RNA polymerase sigma-70 factor (ECF subfamily)